MASLNIGVDIRDHDASCCRSQLTNPRLRSLALVKWGAPRIAFGYLPLHPRVLACTWRTGSPAGLADAAVDSLARLPDGRSRLVAVRSRALEPAVTARLERRLRSLPSRPLVLLVHGRDQGEIPAELLSLTGEHVRHALPRLRLELQPSSGLKVLPFLGSWPV
jgi:hypothetical protein